MRSLVSGTQHRPLTRPPDVSCKTTERATRSWSRRLAGTAHPAHGALLVHGGPIAHRQPQVLGVREVIDGFAKPEVGIALLLRADAAHRRWVSRRRSAPLQARSRHR